MIRDEGVLEQVNELWNPVYPHLAEHLLRQSSFRGGRVLDSGPFGGGVALEVLRRFPSSEGWVASDFRSHLRWVDRRAGELGVARRVQRTLASTEAVPARDRSFDLIVVRGAFFFLTPELLREVGRLLRSDGFAWVGGGYGPLTPASVIEPMAVRSKALNEALGKVRVSAEELEVTLAGMEIGSARVVLEGGLWIEVRG